MSRYENAHAREIMTQAVCGKGSKYSQTTHTISPANRPSSIGGCWVMNHTFDSRLVGESVEVYGTYTINVWYSFDGNSETAVAKDTVSYTETIPLTDIDPNCSRDNVRVIAKTLMQPTTLDATVDLATGDILVRVEKELCAEIVGTTKVWVLTVPAPNFKDDEDMSDDVYEEDDLEI
jgi:spore coat protein E